MIADKMNKIVGEKDFQMRLDREEIQCLKRENIDLLNSLTKLDNDLNFSRNQLVILRNQNKSLLESQLCQFLSQANYSNESKNSGQTHRESSEETNSISRSSLQKKRKISEERRLSNPTDIHDFDSKTSKYRTSSSSDQKIEIKTAEISTSNNQVNKFICRIFYFFKLNFF